MAKRIGTAILFCGALLLGGPVWGQGQPSSTPSKTTGDKSAGAPAQTTAPPVSAEEDAAIKAFRDDKGADLAHKEKLGEEFLQKYPQSRYDFEVENWLVRGYVSSGQVDKMEAAGEKDLQLNPNDAQTMAILGSTLPRAMNASTPNREQKLAQSEQYCKKALELLPTMLKPEGLSQEAFERAKDQTAAMAYGGLGLVAFRQGKLSEAIEPFEKSVKLDPQPDPVNYYLLGLSYQKTSHFEDAVTAYTKCAGIPSGMQPTCKAAIDEAKKLAATQLSAPK